MQKSPAGRRRYQTPRVKAERRNIDLITQIACETLQTAVSNPPLPAEAPPLDFQGAQSGHRLKLREPRLLFPARASTLPRLPRAGARNALLSCRAAWGAALRVEARASSASAAWSSPHPNLQTCACDPHGCEVLRESAARAIAAHTELRFHGA